MKPTLIIKLEDLRLAFLNILEMEVENLREPWPQNVNANLLQKAVEHRNSEDFTHLCFAFFVDFDHD
jgi:hypothetical protein